MVVPFLATTGLIFSLQDIGPAYRARFVGGEPGTFTSEREDCGRLCTSYGVFVGDDGRVRDDVLLASGGGSPSPGTKVRAVDTGNRAAVYPEGGGWDWLLISFILVFAMIALPVWGYRLLRSYRRRREMRGRRCG